MNWRAADPTFGSSRDFYDARLTCGRSGLTVIEPDGANYGPLTVTSDNLITIGLFDGFSWIRCEGKGSFVNSSIVRNFGDERIAAGEHRIVVDLAACTGMDSTFMGTLAGIAAKLTEKDGGTLQIAEPGERNRRSLEDLGLNYLMEINPPGADWHDKIAAIRSGLKPRTASDFPGQFDRARHVLEAHKNLTGISDKNARDFSEVVTMLENELSQQNNNPPQTDKK